MQGQTPIGVATPQMMAVYVGTTPLQLLIFSGVAIVDWESKRNLDTEEVIVRLGATTTPYFEATAVVDSPRSKTKIAISGLRPIPRQPTSIRMTARYCARAHSDPR
jgi:hypothetical protein